MNLMFIYGIHSATKLYMLLEGLWGLFKVIITFLFLLRTDKEFFHNKNLVIQYINSSEFYSEWYLSHIYSQFCFIRFSRFLNCTQLCWHMLFIINTQFTRKTYTFHMLSVCNTFQLNRFLMHFHCYSLIISG